MGGPRRGPGERGGGLPDFGGIGEELTIDMVDGEFHVDDGERLRIYYLDGEKHKRENGSRVD